MPGLAFDGLPASPAAPRMICLAKVLLRLLSWLPDSLPYLMARRCAGVWMWFSPGKRRVAQINLRNCFPDHATTAFGSVLRDSFVHYVCSIFETGRNAYWPLSRLQALCDGVLGSDALDRARAGGRGVLILAPHFGAWEYLGLWLQMQYDMAILYKPPGHPGLEKALLRMRARGGGRMLPATSAGLRQLYAHIGAAGVGALLPDQQPTAGQGRFAPFYGLPALTGVLAPRLIWKTGCMALFVVCERLDTGHYRINAIPADDDIYRGDMDLALKAVNRGVEQCIAIDPAQYLWSYKRFRTQPPGALPLY